MEDIVWYIEIKRKEENAEQKCCRNLLFNRDLFANIVKRKEYECQYAAVNVRDGVAASDSRRDGRKMICEEIKYVVIVFKLRRHHARSG